MSNSLQYVETLLGDIAHLFKMGDGTNKYVVKFYNYRNRTKEIINEYIISRLAKQLDLPVPQPYLTYVTEQLRSSLPDKVKRKVNVQTPHIAIPFIEHSCTLLDMDQLPTKENLLNHNQLAGMIVFDLWVNNSDRSRTNLLIQADALGYYFYMIDHGRCFPGGYNWSSSTLTENVQPRMGMPVYKWAATLISQKELEHYGKHIVNLNVKAFEAILLTLPEAWKVTEDEKEQLILFLVRQQKDLTRLISEFTQKYKDVMNERS